MVAVVVCHEYQIASFNSSMFSSGGVCGVGFSEVWVNVEGLAGSLDYEAVLTHPPERGPAGSGSAAAISAAGSVIQRDFRHFTARSAMSVS